jgi:S-adenosyl methyltransferase
MSELPPEIDTSRPHTARIYDYFLGGESSGPSSGGLSGT